MLKQPLVLIPATDERISLFFDSSANFSSGTNSGTNSGINSGTNSGTVSTATSTPSSHGANKAWYDVLNQNISIVMSLDYKIIPDS